MKRITDEKDLYKPIRKIFTEPPFNYDIQKHVSHIIGDPDLEIYRNNGTSFFIETKQYKKDLEFHQEKRREYWYKKGFQTYVVKDKETLDNVKKAEIIYLEFVKE